MATDEPKRSRCAACGAWGPPGEYHPHAYCLLFRATGSEAAARAELNAVLNYGRKLERLKLPNDAPISAAREPTERGASEHLPPPDTGEDSE